MSTVLASTSQPDGGTTTSNPIQYDSSSTLKCTCVNPAAINTPCIVNLQLSADNITWYTVDSRSFGLAPGMTYITGFAFAKYLMVAPNAVLALGGWAYARLQFTSNTGGAVTVSAVDSIPSETAIVTLTGTSSTSGGAIGSWQPPGGGPVIVRSCNVYCSANSAGAANLTAGVAANTTTSASNLIAATALAAAVGTCIPSTTSLSIASTQAVTFTGSATTAGFAGKAFIEYIKAA
jgi:hypothetical protein